MTNQSKNTNLNVNDHDLWKHLKACSAMKITIPDPEIALTIKKFYPQKEGL
jgi:hypothetical protein